MNIKQKISHEFYKNRDKLGNRLISLLNPKSPKIFKSSEFDNSPCTDLIIVAFNDVNLIRYQHNLMKKYVKNGLPIVCDNSNHSEKATEIFEYCQKNNLTYIKVPYFFAENPSCNHARALNWIMKNIVFKRRKNFLIIDHDIFPFDIVDIDDYFTKPMFGKINRRGNYWYFPPIFCGFSFEFLKKFKPNFMPCRIEKQRLDTGGTNYLRIYQYLAADDYKEYEAKYINIRTLNFFDFCDSSQDDYRDRIEIIDDKWLHLCGGSCWGGKHNKFELAQDYIKSLQKKGKF